MKAVVFVPLFLAILFPLATTCQQTDSSSVTVLPPKVTPPPSVVLISPTASTVSDSVSLGANASDDSGIANVQFMVDGSKVGAPVTVQPYQVEWDTTAFSNGHHSLTAVATGNDGKSSTSAAVSVYSNNVAPVSNMLPNPSVEIPSTDSTQPQGWTPDTNGVNVSSYTYLSIGHSGSHSVRTDVVSFTSGAAFWTTGPIATGGATTYYYSDYYQSNVRTEISANVRFSNGASQQITLGFPPASPNAWSKFEIAFRVPAGTIQIEVVHELNNVGWLINDDFTLSSFRYAGFNRPIVTLTFDDGRSSVFQYALPLLQKYGFLSTQFIISGSMDQSTAYMTSAEVSQLASLGHEIGSHTVTHHSLPSLTFPAMDEELKNSQATLQNLIGKPVRNFAPPYGDLNSQVVNDAALYYGAIRTNQKGLNAKNFFFPYNVQSREVYQATPVSVVQGWIQDAINTNTWLVLLYHQVDPNPPTITTGAESYNTFPTDLDAELAFLKSTGVAVETLSQALAEIIPQL